MFVTEEEAGKKECKRIAEIFEGCWADYPIFCSGSRCMKWRWRDPLRMQSKPDTDLMAKEQPERPPWIPADWTFEPQDDDNPASWVEPEEKAQARRRGYCGLAGKPQEV